jgi:hypothetical protein
MSQTQNAAAMVNAMITSIPLLESQAGVDLVDTTVRRLIQDIAYGIYPIEEIAVRYGFETVGRLREWLAKNPGIVSETSKMRAIHLSDASIKERIALKAGHALEAGIPATSAMSTDPRMPGEIRMKATDALMYMAGVKGGGAAADKQAQTGAQFQLVMQFSGGREERITATVVEGEKVPAPLDDGDEEDV